MIDLYTWTTPNGRKVSIMLEEMRPGLRGPRRRHRQGPAVRARLPEDQPEQQDPGHRRPRQRRERLFESGAILIYLAEKTGQLLPADPKLRLQTLEWLMFQMGGVGPMLGQAHHFLKFNVGKVAVRRRALRGRGQAALRRHGPAVGRSRLSGRRRDHHRRLRHLAMAVALGVAGNRSGRVRRMSAAGIEELAARPGVQRGYDVPKLGHTIPLPA